VNNADIAFLDFKRIQILEYTSMSLKLTECSLLYIFFTNFVFFAERKTKGISWFLDMVYMK
jgi:hypothetical protein